MPEDNLEVKPDGEEKDLFEENAAEFIQSFENILDQQIPTWREKHKTAPIKILSIGYGSVATEFIPLHTEFPNASLSGLEIDKDAIEKEDLESIAGKQLPLNLRIASATEEASYQDENGERSSFDLIVIRSPNVLNVRSWNSVVHQAWSHLNNEGVLYITTSNQVELDELKKIFKSNSIEAQNLPNPNPHIKTAYHMEAFISLAQKQS